MRFGKFRPSDRLRFRRNMNKVILIISDALRYDVARSNMGFLGHLVEKRLATLFRITGELPSMSRPMYETIHTGLPSHEHGIEIGRAHV